MNNYETFSNCYIVLIFTNDGWVSNNPDLNLSQSLKLESISGLIFITKNMKAIQGEDTPNLDDILVIIHPESEPLPKLRDLFSEFLERGKKILVGIHEGSNDQVKIEQRKALPQEAIVREYVHELKQHGKRFWDPVWENFSQFCLAFRSKNKTSFQSYFVQLCNDLMSPLKRLAIIKHRINHLLGPIDLDLQRLEEIAKANDHATFYRELKNFKERYKDFDWVGAFNEIKIIIDGFLETQGKKLTSFSNLNCLIKEERIKKLIDFLNMVKEKEVESVFEELKNIDRNSISFWLRELDKNLDETIEGG